MYYGSDEFNNAIENTQGNALKTRLKFSDEEIIELVSSMRYYGGSNDSDDLMVGNAVSAYVDVTAFTDKSLAGREFLLESGVKLSDGTYEYAPIGYFTVQTPNGDYDEVSFTAYDRMIKFEKVYSSSLTYPTDSAKVLNEICTMCGVTLVTPITNPVTITENLKGYTCREVLGYIAGIHGFFACIDRFGELNLRWYSDAPVVKELRTVWAFEKSQEQYEVEKVEVAKDIETSYTSGDGVTTLYHSNPYATQEITDKLFEKLGGYKYMPAEIEMLDDIRLDPWDVVSVTYYDDIAYLLPCMSIIHDFGASSTTIKSVGKTSVENEYKFTGPTTQYLNRMSADLLVANKLIATKVDAEYVQANAVTVDNLDAIKAEIQEAIVGELSADFITVDVLDAEKARIDTLETNKLDASDLSAEVAKLGYATITQLNASNAKIEELQTDRITATEAKANYADIKLANVGVADVGTLFAKVGLIDQATIVNGHITGFLDAVEINANKITAGTLAVDRLIFRGENSIVYELNNVTGALQAVQGNTLNGEILTNRSITVDKIVANSITANEIAAGAITASELATNAVTAVKIASNAITADKIQTGAITADKIASSSITADKLKVTNLGAISAEIGKLKIDEAGVLTSTFEHSDDVVEEGSLIDDYIKIDYTYAAPSLNDYKYVAGTTKMGFEDFELNRTDTYKIPHEQLFNKKVKVDENNIKYGANGILWNKISYDENDAIIAETNGGIKFNAQIVQAGMYISRVAICELDFYKLIVPRLEIANSLIADYGSFDRLFGATVTTTAGADLDDVNTRIDTAESNISTINSNIALKKATVTITTADNGLSYATYMNFYKMGRIVVCTYTNNWTLKSANTNIILNATIPSEYLPIEDAAANVIALNQAYSNHQRFYFRTSGRIEVLGNSTVLRSVPFTVTWISAK